MRVTYYGSTNQGMALPWYLQQTFACLRCGTAFYLDESDFIVSHGPFLGALLDRRLYWRKYGTSAIDNTALGTDGTHGNYYPDQIYGPCPVCGFNNTYVSPDFGLIHPADASGINPIATGAMQGYISGHAYGIKFFLPSYSSTVYGFIMNQDGTLWQADDVARTASVVYRSAAGLFVSTKTSTVQPGVWLTPAQARSADSILYDAAVNVGLVAMM